MLESDLSEKLVGLNLRGPGGRKGRGDGPFTVHDFTETRPQDMRSKQGFSGTRLRLRANYARMIYLPNDSPNLIHQHHVDFQPPVDSKYKRMKLVEHKLVEEGYDKEAVIFDGMILYLPNKLASEKEGLEKEYICEVATENDIKQKVTVNIRWTKELPPNSPMCLTVLNLINRKVLDHLQYKQYGRNFFNPKAGKSCAEFKLLVWPGFVSSIRCYESELLMNVEQAHKVIRDLTVLDLMKQLMNEHGAGFRPVAATEIMGQVVMTRYNNKTYKVDDLVYNMNPLSTFKRNGVDTTFKQYYKQQYEMDITDDKQCLLLSRAVRKLGQQECQVQEDVYLIPELCLLTGLTEKQRANRKLMQALSRITRLDPCRRVLEAENHLGNMLRESNVVRLLKAWNLQVDRKLAAVEGRQLPSETLTFGRNCRVQTNGGDWTRTSKSASCLDSVGLPKHKWVMVFPQHDAVLAEKLYHLLKRVGNKLQIPVDEPQCMRASNMTAQGYVQAVREGVQIVRTNMQQDPVFVLIMVPNDSKDRYDAVKKECCLDNPVPSQVVLTASAKRENILESIATKILVQMNCKMGGVPWKVENKFNKLVMHVGYDSYHDSSMRGKSVGAAAFTLDKDWTKWFTCADVHGEGSQLINNLHKFFLSALKAFKEKNEGRLPDRIFLWRDGVGEGQIPVVFSVELPQIVKALKEVYNCGDQAELDKKVGFTLTIVTKKVNCRMFREVTPDQYENPPPGTVIDSVVTRKERYDFYLIPQPVNQGTVTPVSYNVIFDTNSMGPDKMQRLAFKLCHLYYNWQGTIRVPAPCMYAYKAAFLVAQSLHKPIAQELADKLVYL